VSAGGVRTLGALLELVRWPNAIIAALGVLVGAWWARGDPLAAPALLAAGTAIALTAFANAYNDYRDIEIDRVAHPGRPLPSGRLSRRAARVTSIVAAAAALLLAALTHPAILSITWAVIVLMWAYSRRVKATGVPGNLLVALLASLPFLYGGWSVGRPRSALPLLAVAVPLHLAREIAKDLDDAAGDAASRRTLPVALGARPARGALLLALAAFALALLPLVRARPSFAGWMIPGLALCIEAARRALTARRGGPVLFKTAMLLAMAALVAAFGRI
jgi:geranylgeranylglycerol-phosphate geranylgeranyltransferase